MLICIVYPDYIKYSFICFMLAGICDMLDGFVARKCKRTEEEKEFGVQLDSLVDVFSFIAFPIVLLISTGLNQWYHIIIFALYAICGVARLGYFNIMTADSSKAIKYYEGMPVTFTALLFPVFYMLKLCVESSILNIILSVVTVLIAILFIAKIKIKKPGVKIYFIFGILAIALTTFYCIFM